MNLRRRVGAWRSVAAALFAALATVFVTAAPSAAYTINFTGTVSSADGVFLAAGVAPGDVVSGSLTYDTLNTTPSFALPPPNSVSVFPQASGSFTFHVSHPGAFDYSHTYAASGQVESNGGIADRLGMYIADSVAGLQLDYRIDATNPALTSLAGLPTDSAGIIAWLTGAILNASGKYRLNDFGQVNFNLSVAVAATPVPATLPLLVSALGALGFITRRRQRGHSGT